jgi:hypothetical protein
MRGPVQQGQGADAGMGGGLVLVLVTTGFAWVRDT